MPSLDYSRLSDVLHTVRTTLDKYQPSVGTAVGLMSGPTGWLTAIPGPQSQTLTNFKGMKGPMDRPDAPAATPVAAQAPAAPMPAPVAPMPAQAPTPAPAAPTPAPAAPWWASASGANFGPSGVPMPQARPTHQGLIDRIGATVQGHPSPTGLIGRMAHTIQGQPSAAPQGQPGSPMGFFQHNAMSMRDPSTGGFIDPTGSAQAQQSQVRGPDLINKMMAYLHQQPTGSIGNNNDPSTMGSG